MAKNNNPTLLAFNSRSAKLPFGRVLNDELGRANSLHTLRRPTRHFIPLNNSKINRYPEILFKSEGVNNPSKSSIIEQYKTYKEDQLMSNPGGDNFFLSKTGEVIDNNYDHSRITKRVGKDLIDAGNNLLNAVKDLGL